MTSPVMVTPTYTTDLELRLAIADAAIAYVERGREMFDLVKAHDAWRVLDRAVTAWNLTQTKERNDA